MHTAMKIPNSKFAPVIAGTLLTATFSVSCAISSHQKSDSEEVAKLELIASGDGGDDSDPTVIPTPDFDVFVTCAALRADDHPPS